MSTVNISNPRKQKSIAETVILYDEVINHKACIKLYLCQTEHRNYYILSLEYGSSVEELIKITLHSNSTYIPYITKTLENKRFSNRDRFDNYLIAISEIYQDELMHNPMSLLDILERGK
jgi:hypothetical protein